jgi:ribosomal protein L11 methyltransferase
LADYPALDLNFLLTADTPAFLELLHACLDEFDPVAIQDTDSGWRVFFRTASNRDCARTALAGSFADALLGVRSIEVPDEQWAERSQARLTPICVRNIVVTPPWTTPAADAHTHVVVIQPSMGFGTGHHATTRLCLQLLQEVAVAGSTVIDIGTGSGVLAIAAWKLGAAQVTAIDCDPDAVDSARENIERNHAVVDLLTSDLSGYAGPPACVVLANLTSAALQRHAAELRRLVLEDGALILSGFAPAELEDIEHAFGVTCARTASEAEWCAARFNPPKAS